MATMFAPKLSGPPDIAAPSAGAAIEGIRQTGQAISGALGIAGSIYEAKREGDISAAKTEVEDYANKWFQEHQAVKVAMEDVGINRQRLAVAQSALASLQDVGDGPERQMFANELGSSSAMLVQVENRMKQDLEQSLGTLRQAQEQNKIGPAEYALRVKTVEDKIRTRYPGLRDRINQEIAKISGLPNAGDFAVYSFVQSQFAPRTADTSGAKAQAELETAETKWISQYTGVSVVDVSNARAQDPVRFAEWKKVATGAAQDVALTQRIKTQLDSQQAVIDSDADRAKPNIQFFARGTLANRLSSAVAKKPEFLQNMLNATKGMGSSEMQQDATYKAWNAVVDSELDKAEAEVLIAMDSWGVRLSDAKRAEMKRLISDEKKNIKVLMGDPNNMGPIAGILRNHSHEVFEIRLRLIQNASSTMAALANTDIAKAWLSGDEAKRTSIRNEFPPLATWMQQNEDFITNQAATLRDAYNNISQGVRVADAVKDAQASPNATPDPTRTKISDSAVAAITADILKKPELSDTDKNVIGTMLSNATNGAAYKTLRSNEQRIRDIVGKLTPEEQQAFKQAAEKTYSLEMSNRISQWQTLSKNNGWDFPVVVLSTGKLSIAPPQATDRTSVAKYETALTQFDRTIAPVAAAATSVRAILMNETGQQAGESILPYFQRGVVSIATPFTNPQPLPETVGTGTRKVSGTVRTTAPAADNVQPTPGGSLVTPSTVTDANVGNLRVPGSATDFQKFATRAEGVQAMSKQLEIYGTRDKIDSIRSAISKWAPPNENDTEAYIKFVSARTGIGADEKIDLTDPAVRTIIMGPMMIMEKGKKSFVRAQ